MYKKNLQNKATCTRPSHSPLLTAHNEANIVRPPSCQIGALPTQLEGVGIGCIYPSDLQQIENILNFTGWGRVAVSYAFTSYHKLSHRG